MSTATIPQAPAGHSVVSEQEWLQARTDLLAKEKRVRREMDELARLRRELPWTRLEKNYIFESAAGSVPLAALFEGRSQLLVYHFMLGPGWEQGCASCSFVADHLEPARLHLAQRDVTFAAVSRAPMPEIAAFQKRMAWTFPWVSSSGNSFNFDFHVSFTPEEIAQGDVHYNYASRRFPSSEAPGMSVFYKNGDDVFHCYSTYGRGLDILLGTYNCLDLTPKGRDESNLEWPMAWVRHHDRYAASPQVSACVCPE